MLYLNSTISLFERDVGLVKVEFECRICGKEEHVKSTESVLTALVPHVKQDFS